MPLAADVLAKEASGLPYSERAKLVDALLTTLDPDVENDCCAAWFAEIGRREKSLADGSAKIHFWDDVKRQARERVNGDPLRTRTISMVSAIIGR
ncbi:MAG: addiction module protein [Deltaproteobacteria bacterium]|nr:addiction module protein [Deltaproteobacteria bacterium]